MKGYYLFTGVLDPRRPDTIKWEFDVPDMPPEYASVFHDMWIQKHVPINKAWFSYREYQIFVDDKRVGYFSGNGPQPPYPAPEGDIIHATISLEGK